MTSYVRVNNKAKTPSSQLYSRAVNEFVRKMGGPWAVIEAIGRAQGEPLLFDNTPFPKAVVPLATIDPTELEDTEEGDVVIASSVMPEEDFRRSM